jgi:hypothetical protein
VTGRCKSDHIIYEDTRGEEYGELHLTLEKRCPGVATSHDVDPEACAAALDEWLRANGGRELLELLVTTARVHHGDVEPIVAVLEKHRPRVFSVGAGALTFPDFDRGNEEPNHPDGDGSSWHLEVPLDRLLGALPAVETVVIHANAVSVTARSAPPTTASGLRSLVLRDEALDPRVVSWLSGLEFPRLTKLELWLGNYEYSWGGSASDLLPLLNNRSMSALEHLTIVSDLGDAILDVLSECTVLDRLTTIHLPYGLMTEAGAGRLHDRWSRFSKIQRVNLNGNLIPADAVAALRAIGPGVVAVEWQRTWTGAGARFEPPLVSLFDAWKSRYD